MNSFTGKLDLLEARLQSFIEGKLSGLSSFRGGYESLSGRLADAMRSGTVSTGDGILLAPDIYILLAHPTQVDELREDPDLVVDLAWQIKKSGVEAGFHFAQNPIVSISSNDDVRINAIDIVARMSDKALGKTAGLNRAVVDNSNAIPANAFLILNGRDVYPLDKTHINIGRRTSNDLMIDDPRVSRHHAQIRAINGRYEIFDLDSTSGTFINQKRVTQSLLRPGDVISLAGVFLIYGQERSSSIGNTQKLPTEDL